MSARDERIREIRGRTRYEDGMSHIRVVARGGREGGYPSYRLRAERMLKAEEELDDERRKRIRELLSEENVRTGNDAILALEAILSDDS